MEGNEIIKKMNEFSQQLRVLEEPYNGLWDVDYIVEMEEDAGVPMTPEEIEKAAHYIAEHEKEAIDIEDQLHDLALDYFVLTGKWPVTCGEAPDIHYREPHAWE